MNVQQKFSLSVFPKWNKATAGGEAPIYIRIKIDGQTDEISLSCKVKETDWDALARKVKPSNPDHVNLNKIIDRARVDIGRHYDLVQAKHGVATAAQVKESYTGPSVAEQVKNQPFLNLQFNESLDRLINRYLAFCKREEKVKGLKDGPTPEMQLLLDMEKGEIKDEIEAQVKAGAKIFDNPNHQKTLIPFRQ